MINKSVETANLCSVTVNIDNIDVNVDFNLSIFVGLFVVGLFWIVKMKVSVGIFQKVLEVIQTFFSKVKPFWVNSSLQVLNLVKIKRTLLLAGLCVLFIFLLFL